MGAAKKEQIANGEVRNMTQRVLAVGDAVGAFIEWWGFKAIHGRIWVLLCVSTRPQSQREIADTLAVSRALVSTAVAELVSYGLVRPTSDHRNAPYEANIDVWASISDVLRAREWMILERVRLALDAAVQEAELLRQEGRPLPFQLSRLRLLLRMTELAQMLLRLLISLGSSAIPEGLAGWLRKAAQLTADLRSHATS